MSAPPGDTAEPSAVSRHRHVDTAGRHRRRRLTKKDDADTATPTGRGDRLSRQNGR
jgi:hypothetical protein